MLVEPTSKVDAEGGFYLRILIGSESFYPNVSGVAVSAWNLAAYLAGHGHEVAVMAPSTRLADDYEKYPEGFCVFRFLSVPNPFRSGFRVTMHPYKRILNAVKDWKPDVIHLEDPASICSCLAKAGDLYNIPVVISHHFTLDYILSYFRFLKPLHQYSRRQLSRYLRNFYNRCQHVICPSETVEKWLISIGVYAPITVISNGVNLQRFFNYESPVAIRFNLGLPDLPIVLYVGRIDLDKRLNILLEAVPLVLKNHPACFVLCGGGNLLERLKKRILQEGLNEHVVFWGQLDHNDDNLPRLYQLASCFVMPSCIETQSIVTMEAMAAGLPVVAADSGALPELVSDGETGFLFKPNNAYDLAEKISQLLDNPEMAEHMGHVAMKKILKHDINLNLQNVVKVYERVVMNAAAQSIVG